jgi:hypothetical protein
LVLSVLLGLCLYFSISFGRLTASSIESAAAGRSCVWLGNLAGAGLGMVFLGVDFSSVIRSAAALLRCASLILLPPVLLQSSLQIEFLCGVDSCFRSSVSHQNLLVNRALGHDAS